jgi:hypothetical protein
MHGLKLSDLMFVVGQETSLKLIEEGACFNDEFFENHVQEETHEDGELDAQKLVFNFIQTLIDKKLELLETLKIVGWRSTLV